MTTQRFCPHCNGTLTAPTQFSWGGWTLDELNGKILPLGIQFTRAETRILSAILRGKGEPVDRGQKLTAALWNGEANGPEDKMADVMVCKIRGKFILAGHMPIGTSWGRGYFMVEFGQQAPKPKPRRTRETYVGKGHPSATPRVTKRAPT